MKEKNYKKIELMKKKSKKSKFSTKISPFLKHVWFRISTKGWQIGLFFVVLITLIELIAKMG